MSAKLARLMTLMSPTFPTGGFGYSFGLEAAYNKSALTSANDLKNWVTGLIHFGIIRNDLIIVAEAWRASEDSEALQMIEQNALSLIASHSRLNEQYNIGKSFTEAVFDAYGVSLPHMPSPVTLPVAVGTIASSFDIPLIDTLIAYGHNSINGLIQAALRLAPVGQRAGVNILGTLEPELNTLCNKVINMTLDDLITSSLIADTLSMHHETLSSRTFLS
jgi:urease accessory protein